MEKNYENKKNKMHLFKFICHYNIYMNKNVYKYYFKECSFLEGSFKNLEFFNITEGIDE